MSVALLCVAGVALDALLGEPRRWHPLVAFGNLPGASSNVSTAVAVAGAAMGSPRGLSRWCR
jgi:cobalamin biosynthesis protein CobD/CbiB